MRAVCLAYPAVHRQIPALSAEAAALAAQLPPLALHARDARRAPIGPTWGRSTTIPRPTGSLADLVGLPPFAVVNAEYDDLRPSGEAFAALLRSAGVEVDAWSEPGTAHSYLDAIGIVAGADRTLDRFARHLGCT